MSDIGLGIQELELSVKINHTATSPFMYQLSHILGYQDHEGGFIYLGSVNGIWGDGTEIVCLIYKIYQEFR